MDDHIWMRVNKKIIIMVWALNAYLSLCLSVCSWVCSFSFIYIYIIWFVCLCVGQFVFDNYLLWWQFLTVDDQIWEGREFMGWALHNYHSLCLSVCRVSVRFQLFIIILYREEHFAINRPSQPTEVMQRASQGHLGLVWSCQGRFRLG